MRTLRLTASTAMVLCLHATLASAQMGSGAGPLSPGGRAGFGGRGMRATPNPTTRPPDMPAIPLAWPRLDPGAVFCHSRDDLIARARMAGDLPIGCERVQEATPVTIVSRVPPGSTEVRVTASGEVGWTDAWLPEKQTGK